MFEYAPEYVEQAKYIRQQVSEANVKTLWQPYGIGNDCWYYCTATKAFCVAVLRSRYGDATVYNDLCVMQYDKQLQKWCVSSLYKYDYIGACDYINERSGCAVLQHVSLEHLLQYGTVKAENLQGSYDVIQQKYKVWKLDVDIPLRVRYELHINGQDVFRSTQEQQQQLTYSIASIDIKERHIRLEMQVELDIKKQITALLQNKRIRKSTAIGFCIAQEAPKLQVRQKYKASNIKEKYENNQAVELYLQLLSGNEVLTQFMVVPNKTYYSNTTQHNGLNVGYILHITAKV